MITIVNECTRRNKKKIMMKQAKDNVKRKAIYYTYHEILQNLYLPYIRGRKSCITGTNKK